MFEFVVFFFSSDKLSTHTWKQDSKNAVRSIMFIQQNKQPLFFQLMHLAMEKMWSKMFYIFLNYIEKNVDPYWSNLETYSDENENGLH